VWVLYERVLPLSGTFGFWSCWYVAFLLLHVAAVASRSSAQTVRDRLAAVVVTSAGLAVGTALVLVVTFTALKGWAAVRHLNFFTQTTATTAPDAPLTQGGVLAGIVGTLEQIGIAVTVSVPLAIATAVYLNEVKGRFARIVRVVVETMSAIPSIVAGLFIVATVIVTLGVDRGRNGFAASLALSIEMLPVVARTAEVVLRLVPRGLREAAYALGTSHWRTVWSVVLPNARAGLVTSVLLGVARVVGETSPILLTSGFTNEFNANPLSHPQVSLPLFTFEQVRQPLQTSISRAFGSALVLLVLVLVLFVTARSIASRGTRGQRRTGPMLMTGKTVVPGSVEAGQS
jgi:phosphate transport system permease protein